MGSSVLRRVALATAAAAVLAGPAAAPAGAGVTYPTSLFMNKKFPAFHGKLHSPNHFCVAGRKVKVFRERHGKDKLLGVDSSADNGSWSVRVNLISGVYYSLAPPYGSAALGITCKPDRSPIAVVD